VIEIHKKLVVDEQGNPSEVIIPWKEFQEIEEILGLDLDEETIEELREAQKDRERGNKDAYINLDEL
jgi:PHD/YefM family antitoxin component YafN of YafNO toxin-antitoxin module